MNGIKKAHEFPTNDAYIEYNELLKQLTQKMMSGTLGHMSVATYEAATDISQRMLLLQYAMTYDAVLHRVNQSTMIQEFIEILMELRAWVNANHEQRIDHITRIMQLVNRNVTPNIYIDVAPVLLADKLRSALNVAQIQHMVTDKHSAEIDGKVKILLASGGLPALSQVPHIDWDQLIKDSDNKTIERNWQELIKMFEFYKELLGIFELVTK